MKHPRQGKTIFIVCIPLVLPLDLLRVRSKVGLKTSQWSFFVFLIDFMLTLLESGIDLNADADAELQTFGDI